MQTPLLGPGAARLEVGDRVYLRHCQGRRAVRALRLAATSWRATAIVDELPTYRGEGKTFL